MKQVARTVLAVACLATGAGPALADAYSSATIGNVTVTLIDLDPEDGVAAGITFLPQPDKFAGGADLRGEAVNGPQGSQDPGIEFESFYSQGAWQSSDLQGSVRSGLGRISGSLTGAATGVGFTSATLEGAAGSSATERAHFWGFASIPGNYFSGLGFVLTANTQVVFSMQAELSATTTIGGLAGAPGGENAYALVRLNASAVAQDGRMLDENLQERRVSIGHDDSTLATGTESWAGVLTTSFSNLGDQDGVGAFLAYTEIDGNSVLSPVPEPSAWALLLGGLGLIGARLRRRMT